MIFVFNASPIIVLAKARLLDLFVTMGESSLIPQAVFDEVNQVDDPDDPARLWLQDPPVQVRVVSSPAAKPFLTAWDLGKGESAVIPLANSTPGSVAILDDMAGRHCAKAHGINIRGTLGLILLAKEENLIPQVGPALDAVLAAGLYIAPRYLAEILSKAGE